MIPGLKWQVKIFLRFAHYHLFDKLISCQCSEGLDLWLALILQDLDSALAKKDWYIKELESNLREQKEVNNQQHEEIRLLNERLNNEAKRIRSLERDCDRLRSEISLLESKVSDKVIVRIASHQIINI